MTRGKCSWVCSPALKRRREKRGLFKDKLSGRGNRPESHVMLENVKYDVTVTSLS
jgi:hypothetical protein